jgi:hypothetical protein
MKDSSSVQVGDAQIGLLLSGLLGLVCGLVGGLATGFSGVSWATALVSCSILPVSIIVPVLLVFGWTRLTNFLSTSFYLLFGVVCGMSLSFVCSFPLAGMIRKLVLGFFQ